MKIFFITGFLYYFNVVFFAFMVDYKFSSENRNFTAKVVRILHTNACGLENALFSFKSRFAVIKVIITTDVEERKSPFLDSYAVYDVFLEIN